MFALNLDLDAVVFDLDATLINLGEHVDWRRAQAEIAEAYTALGCSPQDVEACGVKGLFGMLDEMWETNTRKLGAEKADSVQSQVYDLLHVHEESGVPRCSLMPGCRDALNWVKEQEIRMGVCTSNSQDTAEQALNTQRLSNYFDVVIGRSTAYKMKPSPDQLKACYERLGARPENSVFVGDSHKDVLAGKVLGSYTVAIPVYFTRLDKVKEAGVDAIINSLSELPRTLLEIKT
ncbi:HAD family hydrolase [Candidatus Bathyarchaeota archaeon]|nr:HAD family hydrolase [Candidatus Bathyarchaeota archaeon]